MVYCLNFESHSGSLNQFANNWEYHVYQRKKHNDQIEKEFRSQI